MKTFSNNLQKRKKKENTEGEYRHAFTSNMTFPLSAGVFYKEDLDI